MGPGPKWDPGPNGPGPKWDPGRNGPGPKWDPGPNGTRAQMGPGPKWTGISVVIPTGYGYGYIRFVIPLDIQSYEGGIYLIEFAISYCLIIPRT